MLPDNKLTYQQIYIHNMYPLLKLSDLDSTVLPYYSSHFLLLLLCISFHHENYSFEYKYC